MATYRTRLPPQARDSGVKRFLLLFFKKEVLALLAFVSPAKADPQQIPLTPPATQAEFTTYAMGLWPIQGHFTRFSGELSVDPVRTADCTVSLHIDVASLVMADPDRAKLAVGPKLLDEARFPTLSYQGSCAGGRAAGLLTMHGVTRPLVLEARREGGTVTATGTLRRQDFGVDGMTGLIGRTIKLTFAVALPGGLASRMAP